MERTAEPCGEREHGTLRCLLNLAALGEDHVETGDVVDRHTALLDRAVGVVGGGGNGLTTSDVRLLRFAPLAGLEGGAEGAEVSETDGIAVLDGVDDNLLKGDERSLDVGCGEGALVDDALDDVILLIGAGKLDGGIPGGGVVDGIATLLLEIFDHIDESGLSLLTRIRTL